MTFKEKLTRMRLDVEEDLVWINDYDAVPEDLWHINGVAVSEAKQMIAEYELEHGRLK